MSKRLILTFKIMLKTTAIISTLILLLWGAPKLANMGADWLFAHRQYEKPILISIGIIVSLIILFTFSWSLAGDQILEEEYYDKMRDNH